MARPLLSLFILLVTLTSCDPILDGIINAHARLEDKELAIGNRGVDYRDGISAQVKNDPCDDCYYYTFDFNVNDLPEGLSVIVYDRSVEIIGVPEESGRFNFEVFVWVDRIESYYDDDDHGIFYDEGHLTDSSDRRVYTLTIR